MVSRRIRTVVVDDVRESRSVLAALLTEIEDISLVGDATTHLEALKAVRELGPDLVFLNTRSGDGWGLDFLEHFNRDGNPALIVCSTHERDAVLAFELGAVDYLALPHRKDRLYAAVERFRQRRIERELYGYTDQVREILGGRIAPEQGRSRSLERFVLRSGERRYAIDAKDVDWIEASGNYVKLHTGERVHIYRATLSELEESLPADQFARIHRSTMVRIDRIRELRSLSRGSYLLVLRNGTELKVSRRNRTSISDLLPSERIVSQ